MYDHFIEQIEANHQHEAQQNGFQIESLQAVLVELQNANQQLQSDQQNSNNQLAVESNQLKEVLQRKDAEAK